MTTKLNAHEKKAARAIKEEFNWNVGGWYNCLQDGYEEDIPAKAEAMELIYDETMRQHENELRFAGEDFCRKYIEKLFAKDEDALEIWGEEDKEDTNMTKKNNDYMTWTVKELREEAKRIGLTGASRMRKEDLCAALMNTPEKTIQISKVNMFAFTGMFLGEFDAEVHGDKILVNTTSKGELMFDLETGKEITDTNKQRYANRVEAV